MSIVIMGATSHIAKGVIERFFLQAGAPPLHLYTRSPHSVRHFLSVIGHPSPLNCSISDDYRTLQETSCDVIINCVGVETRNSHNCNFTRYFTVTEEFDNLAINYLKLRNPEALYISFSSGAVYGKGFADPVNDSSLNCITINHVAKQDYYGIVRMNAEAKHRAHSDLRIIDLRIFSYFSSHINLTDGYFITDVIQAIRNNTVLQTDSNNIVRDYLHPDDLFGAVCACINSGRLNRAIDISSTTPAAKQEILDYFSSFYGLRYKEHAPVENISATGSKAKYYSICDHAGCIGFAPRYSSMDSIRSGTARLLKGTIKQ